MRNDMLASPRPVHTLNELLNKRTRQTLCTLRGQFLDIAHLIARRRNFKLLVLSSPLPERNGFLNCSKAKPFAPHRNILVYQFTVTDPQALQLIGHIVYRSYLLFQYNPTHLRISYGRHHDLEEATINRRRTVAPQTPNRDSHKNSSRCQTYTIWKNEIERVTEHVCTAVPRTRYRYHVPPGAERDSRNGNVRQDVIEHGLSDIERSSWVVDKAHLRAVESSRVEDGAI
jgi:hypothetical protein